jgi:hypothetical protein
MVDSIPILWTEINSNQPAGPLSGPLSSPLSSPATRRTTQSHTFHSGLAGSCFRQIAPSCYRPEPSRSRASTSPLLPSFLVIRRLPSHAKTGSVKRECERCHDKVCVGHEMK